MDFAELETALAVTGGAATLSPTSLPGTGLDVVLAAFNGGSSLVVAEAERTVANESISLKGKTTFANVQGAAVEGHFSLDNGGNPQALVRMTMPAGWTFSQSFPDSASGKARAQLDALQLADAALVFSSQSAADVTTAPLKAGLNVVATLQLRGVAAIVDASLHGSPTALLHASLTPPLSSLPLPPLPFGAAPWDPLQWTVPGILAEADLGIHLDLGEAKLEKTRLCLYSPPSTTWLKNNPGYEARQGLAGLFKLEAAGIEADLIGDLASEGKALAISAKVAGATVAKLEDLAGLAPGQSLTAELPSEVRTALEAAGNLALTEAVIGFEESLAGPSFVGFTIGYSGSGWNVFPDIDVQISSLQFFIPRPFAGGGSVTAILNGVLKVAGQPLDVSVGLSPPLVRGQLPTAATVDLKVFTNEFAPELTLPDLTIDEFSFNVEPGSNWLVETTMAEKPPWEFDIGPGKLTLADVNMQLAKQNGADLQGYVSGLLILSNDLAIDAQYEIPGALMVRAQLPEVKLSQLISLLNQIGLNLPDGFDFSLGEPYVLLDLNDGAERFTAAAKVSGLGTLAFTAQSQSGQTGVALAIELEGAPSSLPGLSALQKIESEVGLEEAMLVLSSLEDPGFQLPAMSSFGAPALANSKLQLPSQAGGLVRGLNVYAKLNAAKSPPLQALADWLGISLSGTVAISLGVSLPDPVTDSKLFIAVKTEVDGVSVTGDLGLLMQGGEPGVFLDAEIQAEVESQKLVCAVSASALPNGVLVAGTMEGTLKFGPVIVSNLAIVVGIDLEGVPTLGFVGTFDIPDIDFDGSVAIFLDSANPGKSLLAGSVRELTLATVAKALAPGASIPSSLEGAFSKVGVKGLPGFQIPASRAAALEARNLAEIAAAFKQYGSVDFPTASDWVLLVISEPGHTWHLTDVETMTHYTLVLDGEQIDVSLDAQVYIAPQQVQIGAGSQPLVFQQGMHLDGELDLWVVQVRAKIEAGQSGLAAEVEVAPIELGSGLLKLTDDSGSKGPQLSLSTYAQPNRQAPFNEPHFLLSARIQMLGLDQAGIEIEVGSDGLHVDVSTTIASVVQIGLKGIIGDAANMLLEGTAGVGVDTTIDLGPFGSLPLDDKIAGSAAISLASGQANAHFSGELVFQGAQLSLPDIQIPIRPNALAELPQLVVGELGPAIEHFLLGNAQKWLEWVRGGILSGFADLGSIAHALSQAFQLAAGEISGLMRSAQYTATEVAEALRAGLSLAAQDVLNALDQAGYQMVEAAGAVEQAFSLAVNELAEVLKLAGATAQTAANVLKALGHDIDEVTKALVEVGYDAASVAQSVGSAFETTYTEVAKALQAAGLTAEQIGAALGSAFGLVGQEVGSILNEIGESAAAIASTLRNVFNESVEEVANFLQSALGLGEDALEEALNAAGYAWSEIENVIDDIFHYLNPSNW